MATLDQHQSSKYTKFLYVGDSGTGKTGSFVSLLKAGYSFRILDMDDGLSSLVGYAREAGCDLSKVEYETIRDEYKASKVGPIIKGQPRAFVQALEVLTAWSEIDDPNCFLIMDTLTSFSKAAFEWAKGMNPMAKDPRQWYGTAQKGVEDTIALLSGPQVKMNVIITSHLNYKEVVEGQHKGYVAAVGTALGPHIPKYFDTMILAESIGSGANVKRKIKTFPTGVIDLKAPAPSIAADYPLSTGLAEIVAKLKEQ
jgi:hypothetical protein